MIEIVNEHDAHYITHNGPFHSDDVFATVLLEKLYGHIDLARVNEVPEDHEVFAYDIGFGTYDHHQEDKALRSNGIHYAAVGLIWRDFGHEVLKKMNIPDEFYEEIDDTFILPLDALDNGEGKKLPATITSVISLMNPFWNSTTTSDDAFLDACDLAKEILDDYLYGMVKDASEDPIDYDAGYEWLDDYLYNKVLSLAEESDCFIYNEEGGGLDLFEEYGEEIMKASGCVPQRAATAAHNVEKMFLKPLSYEREEYEEVTSMPIEEIAIMAQDRNESGASLLDRAFAKCIGSERSRSLSVDYVEERIDLSEDHIIYLEKFAPWKGTVLSSLSLKAQEAYVVVFPSSRGGWNFQGIPTAPDAFDVRCKVPQEWLGKRDEELAQVCGVKDASFVHPGGFIGCAKSLEGAFEMAKKVVANTEN